MRIHLGSDHAGFALKNLVAARMRALGHEVVDHGALTHEPDDDYPPYCFRAAEAAVAETEKGSLAMVFGGSGNGEAIAANKVTGARCALAHSDETARLAREHNDANVLSLGARTVPEADALRFAEIFVSTPFSGEARHARRIRELADYEAARARPRA
jgi:ribose 5-phosphate isomerase B